MEYVQLIPALLFCASHSFLALLDLPYLPPWFHLTTVSVSVSVSSVLLSSPLRLGPEDRAGKTQAYHNAITRTLYGRTLPFPDVFWGGGGGGDYKIPRAALFDRQLHKRLQVRPKVLVRA